jgi:uncharacterized spore protein YtfJ
MEQFNLTENVDILFHSLENFTQKEGVIGKAVMQGEKTFLPIVSVTVGYGGGNATMGSNQSMGTQSGSTGTGALGLGAKLNTEAIIIIDNQDVSMLPMGAAGASQLIEKIPQIINGMNQGNKNNQNQNS